MKHAGSIFKFSREEGVIIFLTNISTHGLQIRIKDVFVFNILLP